MIIMKPTKALILFIFWIEFLLFNIVFASMLPDQLRLAIVIWFIMVSIGALYFLIKENKLYE